MRAFFLAKCNGQVGGNFQNEIKTVSRGNKTKITQVKEIYWLDRGEKLFSAFFLSETAIFGKQNISPNKIKAFSREETARVEAVPAPE